MAAIPPSFFSEGGIPRSSRAWHQQRALPSVLGLSGRGARPYTGEVLVFPRGKIPLLLLLVVHCSVLDLFALRIGHARGDGAGFAIRRNDDATADGNLVVFLNG